MSRTRRVLLTAPQPLRQLLFASLRAAGWSVTQCGSPMELAGHLAEHERGARTIDVIVFAPSATWGLGELEALAPARYAPVVLVDAPGNTEPVSAELPVVAQVDPSRPDAGSRLSTICEQLTSSA